MPTKDEVLRDLVRRVRDLETDVQRLKSQSATSEWDEEIKIDEEGFRAVHESIADPAAGELRDSTPPTTATAIVRPAEWDEMNEEQRAAWARQVADTGQPGPIPESTVETEMVHIAGGVEAHFPKPSEYAKEEWAATAKAVCENYAPSADSGATATPEEVEKFYRLGGPLWLCAYDHEFVMGLPMGMRHHMVRTLLDYAPREAAEMSRDLLRADTEDAKQFALEQVQDRKAKS